MQERTTDNHSICGNIRTTNIVDNFLDAPVPTQPAFPISEVDLLPLLEELRSDMRQDHSLSSDEKKRRDSWYERMKQIALTKLEVSEAAQRKAARPPSDDAQ